MEFKQQYLWVFNHTKSKRDWCAVGTDKEEAISKLESILGSSINYEFIRQDNAIHDNKDIFVGDDENLYVKEEDGSFTLHP